MTTPYDFQRDKDYNEIQQHMNVFQIPEIEENLITPTFIDCLVDYNQTQDLFWDIGRRMDVFQIPELEENLVDLVNPDFQQFFTHDKQVAIRKFIITYDTSYLKRTNFNNAEIQFLKRKLWKNKVLTILLQNYLVPVGDRVYNRKYIEGPFSLTIFQGEIPSQVGDLYMTLYIYGEYHRDTRGHCHQQLLNQVADQTLTQEEQTDIFRENHPPPGNNIRFQGFLRQLALETPSFFDFFVETSVDRRHNIRSSVFGHNWGMDYFDLHVCFEEMALWIHKDFSTFDYFGNRQIELNLINQEMRSVRRLQRAYNRKKTKDGEKKIQDFPNLRSFIDAIQYRRLDNQLNRRANENSFRVIDNAKRILLNNGGRVILPEPSTPEWGMHIVPEFIRLGEEQIQFDAYEMLEMKEDFRECFNLEERKTLAVGQHPIPNVSKCRLGRFHDIDARKTDPAHATLNPIELGNGIVMNYFQYRTANSYDMNNTIFLPLIRDAFNRTNLRGFINYINQIEHENNYDTEIGVPILGLTDHEIGQIYGIICFCLTHFPRLQREMNSCSEFYRGEIIAFIINKIFRNHNTTTALHRPLADIRAVLADVITVLDEQRSATITDDNQALECLIMLSGHFFMIYSHIMDLYCLFRLFKTYRLKTDCQPNKNYNVIIYAGDAHSSCYREFIDYHRGLQLAALQASHQAGAITAIQRAEREQRIFRRVYDYRNTSIPRLSCVTLPTNATRPANLGIYQDI